MTSAVLVTVTYYPNISDIRFPLALELCQLAATKEIQTVIVDDSPDHPAVRDALEKAGKGYIKVYQQDKTIYQGKGGALRQAIYNARELLADANKNSETTAIVFAEPEKVDIANHIHIIVKTILDGSTDIVVPKRSEELFRQNYPIEQITVRTSQIYISTRLLNISKGFRRRMQHRLIGCSVHLRFELVWPVLG